MARLRPGEKVLPPVNPSVGLRAEYRRRLEALISAMAKSYARFLISAYRANPPRLAQDATPAVELKRAVDDLAGQWRKNFDQAAPRLARWFAQSTERRSSAMLTRILKDGGFTVQFKMTPVMRDVLDATIEENVGLIRSIPEQFHTQVQGMVMRSVTAGRDLHQLSKDLQERFGVTERRAALIARDQNQKATAAFTRVRQEDLGIDEAIWQHSHGGKEPRRTHLANDGKRYKPSEGWHDPDPKVNRRIWPGELINCRCVSRSVIKGFS
jgi:SPP1 gp7 family putative phage head morphogenesis protein